MTETNDEKARWNGPGASAWIDNRDLLDAMFLPFERILAGAVAPGETVLDIGCGTGSTTLAIARSVGTDGAATGVDVSEPMIDVARRRAEAEGSTARFLAADAQHHTFADARHDRVVSRFGVMFFADPVAAFANLRQAMRPDGEMLFIAWRGRDDNPFMTAADRAASPLLRRPAAPPSPTGQFAFADRERVGAILTQSGWSQATIEPLDVACSFSADDLPRYGERMGPLAPVLRELDVASRERVVAAIVEGYEPFMSGGTVTYTAACWTIRARA